MVSHGESSCATYCMLVAYLRSSISKNNLSSHLLGWGREGANNDGGGDWGESNNCISRRRETKITNMCNPTCDFFQ